MPSDDAETFDLQGHRGARGLLPENTIPAFLRALELDVVTLEMDVVISSDEQVVVSHDPWMSGQICSLPSGAPVPPREEKQHRIFAMPYAEVARYDCGRRGHPRFPTQEERPAAKPLLRDVIAAAEAYAREHDRPPPRYSIETKSRPAWEGRFHPDPETFTRLLYDVLEATSVVERSILQSFDGRTLRVGRRLDSAWRLSLLVSWSTNRGLKRNLKTLGFTPAIYSPDHRLVGRRLLRKAHERGLIVIPWTVNTLGRMQRLKRQGTDGLITDYPNRGRQLLDPQRGDRL